MGRFIFLVVIIQAMVFALVACGSATEQAPKKHRLQKFLKQLKMSANSIPGVRGDLPDR